MLTYGGDNTVFYPKYCSVSGEFHRTRFALQVLNAEIVHKLFSLDRIGGCFQYQIRRQAATMIRLDRQMPASACCYLSASVLQGERFLRHDQNRRRCPVALCTGSPYEIQRKLFSHDCQGPNLSPPESTILIRNLLYNCLPALNFQSKTMDKVRRQCGEAARGRARDKKLGSRGAAHGLHVWHHRAFGEAEQGALAQPPE